MHATQETIRTGVATRRLAGLVAAALLLPAASWAAIDGVENLGPTPTFSLTAKDGYISTPDGGSVYTWGYADGSSAMQLPGPTLIVQQGAAVVVTLTNELPAAAGNVSIVFPGHAVTVTGGVGGLLTGEASPGGSVTYSFVAANPGTFLYHSGTRPDLQVEMGLVGALIVRPTGAVACPGGATPAYNNDHTCYDREILFLQTEIDLEIHRAVEDQIGGVSIDVWTSPYEPEYWMLNGRAAPDTMAEAGTSRLPHQPYNCMPQMHPGERLLLRVVAAGHEPHPYHHHGNHARILARDGRLLANGGGQLLGPSVFTITTAPGGTTDAIFEWTGKGLGWDIYGVPHTEAPLVGGALKDGCDNLSGYDSQTGEWCPDHGNPFPVDLPALSDLTFGGLWSGSPFLGVLGSLPPGEGGLNPTAGFSYMWHSHAEREMINNDIFPGGMMTMLVIHPPGVDFVE